MIRHSNPEKLSGGTAGQRLDEQDARRYLVGRQDLDEMITELLLVDRGIRTEHHRRRDIFAQGDVRYGERKRLQDSRMAVQGLVDPERLRFHAAAIDHLLEPATQREVAILVEPSLVPGPEPGLSSSIPMPPALCRILVPSGDARATDSHLPDLGRRARLARSIQHRHFRARRHADRARSPKHAAFREPGAAHLGGCLGHPVHHDDRNAEQGFQSIARRGCQRHRDRAKESQVAGKRRLSGPLHLVCQGKQQRRRCRKPCRT